MSTSFSVARARRDTVLEFPYADISAAAPSTPEEAAARLKQERLEREQAAHATGMRDGEIRARANYEQTVQEFRAAAAKAVQDFAVERKKYFLAVEKEVVKLAINIARKILRRESQIDPLLLTGMARVVLEQIDQKTGVSIRAHPEQVSALRNFFARHMPESQPEITEDANLDPARCVLETSFGSTEIGPEVQLQEIERGLLDLQGQKPQ